MYCSAFTFYFTQLTTCTSSTLQLYIFSVFVFLFLVAFTELARCFLYFRQLRDCDSLEHPTYMKLGRFVNTIRDTTFTFLV